MRVLDHSLMRFCSQNLCETFISTIVNHTRMSHNDQVLTHVGVNANQGSSIGKEKKASIKSQSINIFTLHHHAVTQCIRIPNLQISFFKFHSEFSQPKDTKVHPKLKETIIGIYKVCVVRFFMACLWKQQEDSVVEGNGVR